MLKDVGCGESDSLEGELITNMDGFVISVHVALFWLQASVSLRFSHAASHFVFFLGGKMQGS
jgi:hypothetical protein